MDLATVTRLLLLPGSTIESPNTITAGTDSFSGSFTRASVLHKIVIKRETMRGTVEEEEEDKSIFFHYFGFGRLCGVRPMSEEVEVVGLVLCLLMASHIYVYMLLSSPFGTFDHN